MSQRFFGNPEMPLFGVYHAARGRQPRNNRAVIICPPIGQEYIRTHWQLRLLANQLSRCGVHVLRLDYFGIGDSSKSIEHVDSLDCWEENIEQAVEHLKTETSAETVSLVGQRFGGILAARVAQHRADVNSVVLWEPVTNGQSYLEELRGMHAQMMDLWVCKMETPNNEDVEEVLGSTYSRVLLNEIEGLKLRIAEIQQPHLIIDAAAFQTRYAHPVAGLQKLLVEEDPGGWSDLEEMETARLRPITTGKIVKTMDNMFDRLDRFQALTANSEPADFHLAGSGA